MDDASVVEVTSGEMKPRPRHNLFGSGPLKKKTDVIEVVNLTQKYKQNVYHYDVLNYGKRVIATRYSDGKISLIAIIGHARYDEKARQVSECWMSKASESEIDQQVEKLARNAFSGIRWDHA